MITSIYLDRPSDSIYNYIPSIDSICSRINAVWDSFVEGIGRIIRDAFFLPLANKLSAKNEELLQKEITFYKDFWNPEEPIDPQLPFHQEIRAGFTRKMEGSFITVNGKQLQVEYSVIESHSDCSREAQTIVFALGSLSTLDNNIISAYPFLASYIEKANQDPSIPPLRVICISQYDTKIEGATYRAKTLDESGQILAEVLKDISENTGPISQVIAHSLGSIILAAALKHATALDVLPLNLYFDRGPSSIEKVSEGLGLTGWVALQLAKFSGWDIDVGLEIKNHLSNRPGQNVLISEVINDHHFSGPSSLLKSPHLASLDPEQGIHKLSFDFPDQLYHNISHHNLNNRFLDGYHLVPRNFQILKNSETMAAKIMEQLIPSVEFCDAC